MALKDFGLYHPFTLHNSKNKIRAEAIYKFTDINFIVRGTASCTITNVNSGITTSLSQFIRTWEVNGISYTATSIQSSAGFVIGQKYYLTLTVDGDEFYTDIIERVEETCVTRLSMLNDCNNINWAWVDAGFLIDMDIYDIQQDTTETSTTFETIITAQGEKRQLKQQIQRHKFWFVAAKGYSNFLNGAKGCSFINLNTEIKNFDFTEENIDDFNSSFVITFEYINEQIGNDCCEDIDLDVISNPDGGGGGVLCDGFEVSILNTSDNLTVTLTGAPIGTPIYRWFRNNLQISTASNINIIQSGNYRVDVVVGGCRATSTYFKDDVCGAITLRVYSVGNFVNADLSNIPDGCTPSISVTLNGIEVATSVPYEVLESGTYFVKVEACNCVKSGGVFVNFSEESDCDFTASITQSGNILTAVTDALTPTYSWELETGSGRNIIGAISTQNITLKGIYFLTITSGGCSKEVYKYIEPLAIRNTFLRQGGTGTSFTILGIDLTNITNYVSDIRVTINGVVFSYVAGVPNPNQYTVNVSGQIVVQTSLSNPTIIVELI